MDKWILFAFISMIFAGFTSVIAKMGLTGIRGELGLTIRTIFVFGFVLLFAAYAIPMYEIAQIERSNWLWLGLSGLTTALSWVFYDKALKAGDVAAEALIDKGSVAVAILLAWLLLSEAITRRIAAGAGLIVAGLLLIAKR